MLKFFFLLLIISTIKPIHTKCKVSEQPIITIGIFSLEFTMATYKRYKNKFKNLKKQIDDLNNSGNSISIINNLDKTFLKNDVLFRQTLDPKIESLKTSFKNLKKTIKDYFIKFSDEDSFCYSNNPQESLSSFNGNEYMYFSTAYAKIFLGWNQFDKLLPTAKEEKYFFEKKWNKYVRIVPIDYTILESHGRQAFKKILRKLDGIVLTGGNASFYEDIEPSGLNQKNFTKNMTYPELVQAYLKQLENKIEVSDGIKLKKIKTTYLQGISDVVNIVKEINQDKDKDRKKIPIFGLCLGMEALLLNAADQK